MFWANRSLCSTRLISNHLIRCLPRIATSSDHSKVEKSSDYAVINSSQQPATVVFNDYNIVKPTSTEIRSRPIPKSVPKLIDVQTGLNHLMSECDERMLLMTIENKYKLFDSNNVATFIQRLQELNIKRDSNEKHHQRFYDFVDYLSKKNFDLTREAFFILVNFELPMIMSIKIGHPPLENKAWVKDFHRWRTPPLENSWLRP
jgi:hypothetical protein